ncbi:testis-specific serine/threonine-protein kinase 4-like [Mytilus californianus]|uniref:testis-specific serine/threonine-protein kinase 4-like n=1 Tax=Mytilus californianus TaxID=6549 RepID=UPI002246FDF9|nr:testis-specific serine/threonine-protein kinase 4-like [Mytilus californianus]
MNSEEPERKKRKMEPHIGGDSCQIQEQSPSKSFHNLPSGSASGDFNDVVTGHHFVSVAASSSGKPDDKDNLVFFRQKCDLGDEWEYKYPIPLSKYPNRQIKTGNIHYDAMIPDLELLGYRPLQVIAKGRSGTIILAQDLHKKRNFEESEFCPVALKLNTAKSRSRSRYSWKTDMTFELNHLRQLHHPHILSWLNNICYEGRYGIVLEFCENGTLEQLLKVHDARFLTEPVSHKYFNQIFSGIEYLHLQGIAHRDLCTENILVTSRNSLKISDFGHAVFYFSGDPLRTDNCGSTGFQAPEILMDHPYDPKVSDVWSSGCILYLMCTGRYPLGLIKSEFLNRASKEIEFPETRVLSLTFELKQLVRGLLTFCPHSRFSLNRTKYSEWMMEMHSKVQIGNFYMIRQPKKIREGQREQEIKSQYGI